MLRLYMSRLRSAGEAFDISLVSQRRQAHPRLRPRHRRRLGPAAARRLRRAEPAVGRCAGRMPIAHRRRGCSPGSTCRPWCGHAPKDKRHRQCRRRSADRPNSASRRTVLADRPRGARQGAGGGRRRHGAARRRASAAAASISSCPRLSDGSLACLVPVSGAEAGGDPAPVPAATVGDIGAVIDALDRPVAVFDGTQPTGARQPRLCPVLGPRGQLSQARHLRTGDARPHPHQGAAAGRSRLSRLAGRTSQILRPDGAARDACGICPTGAPSMSRPCRCRPAA